MIRALQPTDSRSAAECSWLCTACTRLPRIATLSVLKGTNPRYARKSFLLSARTLGPLMRLEEQAARTVG